MTRIQPRGPLGAPLLFEDPCVVFALARESQSLRRRLRPTQRFAGAPCAARFCGPEWLTVLVLETGVGRLATERALAWLFSRPQFGNVPYRPKVVISAGFCGGLKQGLHTGDVVLATEVIDAVGSLHATTWPGTLPPGPWDPPLCRGRLLTVPTLVGAPADKLALAEKHQAIAVDMEGAVLARSCQEANVPFGCVRVVLDECDQALSPRLVSLLAGGRISPLRLACALVRAPLLVGQLWHLGRQRTSEPLSPLGVH